MRKLYTVLAFLFCQMLFAQVGINTTTPNAVLDIRSGNQAVPTNTDGMLIPKIDSFPAVNPTVAQQGMLVYLVNPTTFLGNPKPYGFYYWDNNFGDWMAVGGSNPNNWNTSGNAGTNPATHFIGTTDNTDLIFKINNGYSGRLGLDNTSFGFDALVNPQALANNSAFGKSALSSNRFGADNIAFGYLSLLNNQDGDRNIAIGNESLRSASNSNDNLSIGHLALSSNFTGEFNVAVGNLALQLNTGQNNTAVGFQSQYNSRAANENVAVGKNSLINNQNGNENAAFGNYTMANSAYSEHSTAVGHMALFTNFSFDNTAVGHESMLANNFGKFNTALGKDSLKGNTTGESNTSVGINSLYMNLTGSNNTALGSQATTSLNNLTNATAIGANAMVGSSNAMVLGSVSGFNGSFNDVNVGIGTIFPTERLHIVGNLRIEDGNQGAGKVLTSNSNGVSSWQPASSFAWGVTGNSGTTPGVNYIGTSDVTDVVFKRGNIHSGIINSTSTSFGFNSFTAGGSNNAIFGAECFPLGAGNNNAAFGYQALNSATFCSGNTAIGTEAMVANTLGSANTAVGMNALDSNTSGNLNTAVGFSSAPNVTSGFGNTAVGMNSLIGILSGTNNTAIGTETLFNGASTNSSAIGAYAQVDMDNAMVLGSVNGMNGATSTISVGIGTTAPLDRLHVVGSIRMVDGNQAAGSVMISDANGKASWGAFSPNAWGITGNSGITAANFIGTTNDADLIFKRFSTGAGKISTENTFFGLQTGNATTGTNNTFIGAEAGRDNRTGQQNVFIGKRAGASGLTASDNVMIGNAAGLAATANQNTFIGSFAGNSTVLGGNNTFLGYSSGTVNVAGSRNTFIGGSSNAALSNLVNATAIGANAFVGSNNSVVLGSINGINSATSSTNVGIGTTTPFDRLHVVGNIRMVDGNQAAGKVLTSNVNGTASWGDVSASAWGLTGNTGIGATNFIGSTNDADLIFKRNNVLAGKIALLNTSFGLNSFLAPTSLATQNTAFGVSSIQDITSGIQNTAFGFNSLLSNTQGFGNTAVGCFSLNQNTQGGRNTAIGRGSLNTNTTGIENAGFGFHADVLTNNLTNATAVGAYAAVGASNSIVLGSISGINFATNNTNVGIGTTTPLDRLHVLGNIRMVDGNQATGRVLTSNGNGTGSWQSITANAWGLNGNAGTNDPAVPAVYGTTAIAATEDWNGTTDANDYVLGTNGIERFRIKQTTGFVGIGTSAPARALHLFTGASGGVSNASADFVLESNGPLYQHFLTPSTSETGLLFGSNVGSIRGAVLFNNPTETLQFRTGGNTNRMVITSAGDVGIGNTPGGQFELSLDEGRKPGTTVWTVTSDARLKTVDGNFTLGLDEIKKLQPIRYHYKNAGKRVFESEVLNTEFSGLLAQDVQKIFPNCVATDDDGYLNLNMHDILIASINALKELDAKNTELKSENEQLKAKLKQHDEQIASILAELAKGK